MHSLLARSCYGLVTLLILNISHASTRPLNMVPIERKYLPQSALQEGSLANDNLHAQARDLVVNHLQQFGCQAKTLNSYLLKLPYGKAGERRWQELWQAKGCGDGAVSAKLTFQERNREPASITIISDSDE